MDTTGMRAAIHHKVDELDERFLQALHAMLCAYQEYEELPIGYELDGTPIYGRELGALLDKEVEAGKQGKYITVEELDKKADQWLKQA